ncbi:swollenin like protein [Xylariales sp. PMI_506]|nr:swollenin like protein [Xylariales sp. PMI_506]
MTQDFGLSVLICLVALVGRSVQQSCSAAYGQCGGIGWNGATCCTGDYVCAYTNAYYSQCLPADEVTTTATGTGSGSGTTSSVVSSYTGPSLYTTTETASVASHSQSAYPSVDASSCGDWTLVDNVCCPLYCSNQNESSSCDSTCTGTCVTPPSEDCKSGDIYTAVESTKVSTNEDWHFSRSTHFGLTSGGACGFGLYGLCTQGSVTASWTDPMLGDTCTAFCAAYPLLCQDPTNTTWRGNFAAPNGNYYTQFWPDLEGDLDNYLSCGECMEVIRTYPNGSDYLPSDPGYTPPIVLEIVDSCPCDANPKWCCGPGADHCGEIDFTYGCPLPENSIHLDLSDIAMGRLQGGGSLAAGVIPTRYRRIPCPTLGSVYIWLRDGAGPYYFALTAVNTAGTGSVVSIEVMGAGTNEWVALDHDPNYTSSRPQERYGAWVIPQGSGPFNVPIAMRLTNPSGEQIVSMDAITTLTAPAGSVEGFYYIDLGVQFTT